MKISIYDCTLREGMQGVGTSFSVKDKIRMIELLDYLGVAFIEAGNPYSNPKDSELYSIMRNKKLKNAKLIAFGSTCRHDLTPKTDPSTQALLDAGTEYVCIFGKSWDLHVSDVLKTTKSRNLGIISDTIQYLKSKGKKVIFDAEHFFDGCKSNKAYAFEAIHAAHSAGAEYICLCDTNGGSFPPYIQEITQEAVSRYGEKVGIHCHNDTGMAVANTVTAVMAGAVMAQTTMFGWGERCGNADTCIIIPDLQLKLGYHCIEDKRLKELTPISREASQIANIKHTHMTPYVGRNAFSHKAGMHIDAVSKNPQTFEHVMPESVGNERQFLISEVAGRVALLEKIHEFMPDLDIYSNEAQEIMQRLKELEFEGFQFEGADASFELLVRKMLGKFTPYFELESFSVVSLANQSASAMVNIKVGGKNEIMASVGLGPVDALDRAARRTLESFYPCIKKFYLSDYKVRVLDSSGATASKVRVLIESTDGENTWTTIGVSTDIIQASWQALMDSLEYMLMQENA